MSKCDIDKLGPRPWERVVKHGDVSVVDANRKYVVKAKDFTTQFSSSDAYYYFIECTLLHEELMNALDYALQNWQTKGDGPQYDPMDKLDFCEKTLAKAREETQK